MPEINKFIILSIGILEINPAMIELIIKENRTLTLKMHNKQKNNYGYQDRIKQ